ncbi:MAG: HmuY family protein [Cytophagales bacterium]|nr:HmuY family protein [Cytophagales bacterium]
MSNSIRSILFLSFVVSMLAACKKDDPTPVTLTSTTFSNLPADPPSGGYNPTNGQPIGVTKQYTLFSFKTGAVVAHADSASAKWDIGFNGTTIIVNSGTSGPGTAGAFVQTGVFNEIMTAPVTGYKNDDKNSTSAPLAIPKGSGNGWYNYSSSTNVITPIAGRVILVKTTEARYAKMEILSYYKDSPATPSNTSVDRYYTFRYVYQGSGTTAFQ